MQNKNVNILCLIRNLYNINKLFSTVKFWYLKKKNYIQCGLNCCFNVNIICLNNLNTFNLTDIVKKVCIQVYCVKI